MRMGIWNLLLVMMFAIVLWEKLEFHNIYTKPISMHWFSFTCERAAARMKISQPFGWRDATFSDGGKRYDEYKLTYECWPESIDPRGPKR